MKLCLPHQYLSLVGATFSAVVTPTFKIQLMCVISFLQVFGKWKMRGPPNSLQFIIRVTWMLGRNLSDNPFSNRWDILVFISWQFNIFIHWKWSIQLIFFQLIRYCIVVLQLVNWQYNLISNFFDICDPFQSFLFLHQSLILTFKMWIVYGFFASKLNSWLHVLRFCLKAIGSSLCFPQFQLTSVLFFMVPIHNKSLHISKHFSHWAGLDHPNLILKRPNFPMSENVATMARKKTNV